MILLELLMMMLQLLTMLLLGLLVLVLLSMAVPFRYHAEAHYKAEQYEVFMVVEWFWKLFRFRASFQDSPAPELTFQLLGYHISLADDSFKPRKQEKKKDKKDKKKVNPEQKQKKNPASDWPIDKKELLNTALRRELMQFLKRIFRQISPEELLLRVDLGFDDPYHTAVLNHWLLALSVFRVSNRKNIHVYPIFHEEKVNVHFKLLGSLIPFIFLWHSLRLAFSRPVRNIWMSLIKHKLTKKRRRKKYVNEFE